MAPFPETEIMTIKRLEVALRKMDFKLLKDGAYKLHEKYHSGFKFEYLDLLKDLFLDISNNASIPEDIKDILTPTIEDILSSQGIKTDTTTSPYDAINHNRVSSLTSLTYNTNQQKTIDEPKMNAFSAFGTNNSAIQNNQPQRIFTQSPFSAEPFKELNLQQNSYANQPNLQVQNNQQTNETNEKASQTQQQEKVEFTEQNKIESQDAIAQENTISNIQEQEVVSEIKKELKSVAIFIAKIAR